MKTLLNIVGSETGFGIIDFDFGAKLFSHEVVSHARSCIEFSGNSLDELESWLTKENHFEKLRAKQSRIFSPESSLRIFHCLPSIFPGVALAGVGVTDEEETLTPNFYFRVVRPDSPTDVGDVHADQWFWDLRKQNIPDSHRRVKLWAPLKQSEFKSGLSVLPGSHQQKFSYDRKTGPDGRLRPAFTLPDSLADCMINAPIQIGQAILFDDRLLHVGTTTDALRISVEFTLLVPKD